MPRPTRVRPARLRPARARPAGSRALVLLALLPLVAAGCSAMPSPDEPPMPGPPAGLEAFYDQELDYEGCADYATTESDAQVLPLAETAECARLTVPLDYDEPEGETIELGVLRVPSPDEDPIGSLVLNPGGPASPGVGFAALAGVVPGYAELADDFDLVGFDMRGSGSSTPVVSCLSGAERDDDVLMATFMFGAETWEAERTEQFARDCAEGSGGEEIISHLGSRDTARDMDVLRAVLGDAQLNFLGASYGTRLGAVYAEMFPENLRALVLDGGMDPNLGIRDRMVQQYGGFQRSFDAWATACAAAASCPAGDDPAQATERFQELVQPLATDPLAVGPDRQLTHRGAVEAVLRSLYSREGVPSGVLDWAAITDGLTELAAGRGESLLTTRDISQGRQGDGSYFSLLEAAVVTHCNDRERFTPEQETRMREDMLQAAPFLDDGLDRPARDVCESWPGEPTLDYPYATDVDGLPPTLVVSITGDPASPHEGGVALAETLGSSLLTVTGEKHGATLIHRSECVDRAVADYLIDLKVPAAHATCTL